jgi:endonuclease/exonuclease/phosphatase family metal-dependent hydrolase
MKLALKIVLYLAGLLFVSLAIFLLVITIFDYQPSHEEVLFQTEQGYTVIDTNEVYNVMTWNIGYGGLGKDMDFFYDGGSGVRTEQDIFHRNIDQIMHLLFRGRKIDFCFLQEVDIHSKRSYYLDQFEVLQARLDYAHYSFARNYDVLFVPVPLLRPMGSVKAGQVSMSRYIPLESTRYALPGNYPWPKGLFLLDRCFILERYQVQGGNELVLINTHNSAFDDGSFRKKQLDKLLDMMQMEYSKGNFVVAGGDWNMNPPGFDPSAIYTGDAIKVVEPAIDEGTFPEGWTIAFDPQVPTNRSLDQAYFRGSTKTTVIDYFVCSPNVQVIDSRGLMLMFEHSDHNPVLMQFILRRGKPGNG